MEHAEEFALRHEDMVSEKAVIMSEVASEHVCDGECLPRNDRVVHYRFIRLLLKVAIPTRTEFFHVILTKLLLSWSHLDTSLNTVGSKRPGPIGIPLVVDPLLHIWVTSNKIIEALSIRFRSVC